MPFDPRVCAELCKPIVTDCNYLLLDLNLYAFSGPLNSVSWARIAPNSRVYSKVV